MPSSSGEHDSKRSVVLHDDLPVSPCYISSRSADVILSDVRPTKLSSDALNSINAFLDELLYTVLSAARTLTTTQLRAGLHKALPTTLGKEAVLEAELELRAYWERTGGIPGPTSSQSVAVEDSTFNLPWTFELLRLKCEAYSTLSDTDENSDAETRLFQRMGVEGIPPPKQALLAPASLYLTAIIESICEHIVSNVGRVAARDSSRATANGQDLFVALCEDSAIYGLFKNMAVYGQIEALSKLPRSRRSMSITPEYDGSPMSIRRNGSIHQSRTRLSSESVNNAPTSTTHSSRPSSRAVKMLYNKVSQDFVNPSDPGHRKADSFASANTKQSLASKGDRSPISPTFSDDTRSQEFDDMMRSGSTMKVSLTPDRLRTMEALNREKARANGRQKASLTTEKSNGIDTPLSYPSEQTKRTTGPTPSIRRAGSIVGSEDDRLMQKPPPTSRPRQLSAATTSSYTATTFTRVRASSTTDPSTTASNMFSNKHILSESNFTLSDQRLAPGSIPRRKAPPQELDLNASRSLRARTVAHSRESLELEDIMAGSDDDDMGELKPFISPKQHDRQRGFSANTRELIAFLAEGPPELAPSENSLSPLSPTPKKSGRLQKMISRITLASDTVKPPRKMTVGSGDAPSKSMTNLSPLANRPVPPRYPISGPPSATSSERGLAEQAGAQPRQRSQSYVQKPLPSWDSKSMDEEASGTHVPSPGMEKTPLTATIPVSVISQRVTETNVAQQIHLVEPPPSSTSFPPTSITVPVRVRAADTTPMFTLQHPRSPSPTSASQRVSSKNTSLHQKFSSAPASERLSPLPSVVEHAHEMRTMLEHATTAAECRILVDMFLARSNLGVDKLDLQPLTIPSSLQDSGAHVLESRIVELFLGDGEPQAQHKLSLDSCSADPAETPFKGADATVSASSANWPLQFREPH